MKEWFLTLERALTYCSSMHILDGVKSNQRFERWRINFYLIFTEFLFFNIFLWLSGNKDIDLPAYINNIFSSLLQWYIDIFPRCYNHWKRIYQIVIFEWFCGSTSKYDAKAAETARDINETFGGQNDQWVVNLKTV